MTLLGKIETLPRKIVENKTRAVFCYFSVARFIYVASESEVISKEIQLIL